MEDQICKCGCGEMLPATNKSGFRWGHKGKALAPPQQPQAQTPEPLAGPVAAPSLVNCLLSEEQLDRIWTMLPLPEKGLAITEALNAIRE